MLTAGQNKKPVLYIGNLTHAEPFKWDPTPEWLAASAVLPNCGLPHQCPEDHVAVSVNSPAHAVPNICVAGKIVMERRFNDGGRGLNIVTIHPGRLQPVAARRFDTFAYDSGPLEQFLRTVPPRYLLLVLAHDEASRQLSSSARNTLARLGSGQAQNLGFRDLWFMIGQAGIKGLTPYEQFLPRRPNKKGKIVAAQCVPSNIVGQIIQPDPPLSVNPSRAHFCANRSHLTPLCAGRLLQEPVPSCPSAVSHALQDSPILSSPVLVLAGIDLLTLTLTLHTVAAQPGLKPKLVVVAYDPSLLPEVAELCQVFSFTALPVQQQQQRWHAFVEVSLQLVRTMHPSSEYVAVLEEGTMLSPDYFTYVAAVLPLLADPQAMAVSAWNPNGYSGLNSRPEVVLRLDEAPGLAFVVTWQTVMKHLLHSTGSCCSDRGWRGWRGWVPGGWVVAPEVSRVLLRPRGRHMVGDDRDASQLFGRLRRTSVFPTEVVLAEELRGERYHRLLASLLDTGTPLLYTAEQVRRCAAGHLHLTLPPASNSSNVSGGPACVLAYKEAHTDSWAGLTLLCRCFGLYDPGDGGTPKGLYRGLLRFSLDGREVLFFSNRSPLFADSPHSGTKLTLP